MLNIRKKETKYFYFSIDQIVNFYYELFIINWEKEFYTIKCNRQIIKDLIKNELEAYTFFHGTWQVNSQKLDIGIKELNSKLGHITNIWHIDWAWIIHHIILDYKNIQLALTNFQKDNNTRFYKYIPLNYYPLAESLYLKNIDLREPKIFTFNELLKNGGGLKGKTNKYLPIIGAHLWGGFDNNYWDLTELKVIPKGYYWDNDKKRFSLQQKSSWIFRRLRTPIPEITGHFSRKNFLSKIKNYSSLFFKNFRTDLVPSKCMR